MLNNESEKLQLTHKSAKFMEFETSWINDNIQEKHYQNAGCKNSQKNCKDGFLYISLFFVTVWDIVIELLVLYAIEAERIQRILAFFTATC